jgi:hypothetical protein
MAIEASMTSLTERTLATLRHLAPANSVRGRISIVCSSTIDLNPATEIVVMAGGCTIDFSELPFDLVIPRDPLPDGSLWCSMDYRKNWSGPEVLLANAPGAIARFFVDTIHRFVLVPA